MLLVAQDEVVGALVVRLVAAALCLGVHRAALLVHREVAAVRLVRVDALEVRPVCSVQGQLVQLLGHAVRVLLLKDLAVADRALLAILAVGAVLGHLVDKEE